jgi:hypothetical protein
LATNVPEEWLPRGGNPAIQDPAYRLADIKTEKARRDDRRAFATFEEKTGQIIGA